MDEKLAELMPWEGGTFVEAGAHDGYTQSNTYFLERFRGWSGVLIEPIPELSALCSRRRRRSKVLGCALVGDDFHGSQVTLHFGDLMSTTGDRAHAAEGLATAGRSAYEVEVPARTLTAALTEAASPPVDLMVLDLEGHELDALSGLDMDRYAPRYLLLEALEPEVQKPQFDQMLAARYAPGELASPYDLLYRRLT